ncbi:hypothetical protein I4F81_006410 [Pyropia yezoensis]|uniref:Uncharacterized protein n=1 Tax=Pyropia yezoensis TaxID=2788 RepID=A0ACC3C273_PYRYE|nr:hypothetical protein I4F81_006410 [Neopyropia yezoensis]
MAAGLAAVAAPAAEWEDVVIAAAAVAATVIRMPQPGNRGVGSRTCTTPAVTRRGDGAPTSADDGGDGVAPPPPRVALPLLATIKAAQGAHGLAHGDYRRYRRYCSRRLHRLRVTCKATHAKARYTPHPITAAAVAAEPRLLEVPLMTAEQVDAYVGWVTGHWRVEAADWVGALAALATAGTLYGKMGAAAAAAGGCEGRGGGGVYADRGEEIAPLVRFCAYHLRRGGGSGGDGPAAAAAAAAERRYRAHRCFQLAESHAVAAASAGGGALGGGTGGGVATVPVLVDRALAGVALPPVVGGPVGAAAAAGGGVPRHAPSRRADAAGVAGPAAVAATAAGSGAEAADADAPAGYFGRWFKRKT